MRSSLAAAAVIVGVLGLSACGGGNDPTPTAAGGGCRTVTVTIGDFKFAPTPVKVHRCDSVVWKNTDQQAHTSTGSGDQSWNTGNIEPGKRSKAVRFGDAGTFAYQCSLHPFMHGEVRVS